MRPTSDHRCRLTNGLVFRESCINGCFFPTEEICTLVIAEAFPEDGGLFSCTASNPYGSINSTAQLTVTAGELQSTGKLPWMQSLFLFCVKK